MSILRRINNAHLVTVLFALVRTSRKAAYTFACGVSLLYFASAFAPPAVAQGQPPGISLGTFPLNQAITNIASQLRWAISTVPINPSGMIYVNYTGTVTGSPSGCLTGVAFASTNVTNISGSGGTFIFDSPTVAITPGAAPLGGHISTDGAPLLGFTSLAPVYTCTTYPTGGTVTFEFVPDPVPLYNYLHVTTNNTFLLKGNCGLNTCIGTLHAIVINQPGTSETITVFDSQQTACTSPVGTVAIVAGFNVNQSYIYDATTTAGLCIQTSGTTAGDYTIVYR